MTGSPRGDTFLPSSTFIGNLARVARGPCSCQSIDRPVAPSHGVNHSTTQQRTLAEKGKRRDCGQNKEIHRGVLLPLPKRICWSSRHIRLSPKT